jgi:hypothetical protein
MAKERKSPPEKKAHEYSKDHFTFGSRSARAFPKVWKRKKTHANQEFRRKSSALLTQAKPGLAAEDAILITGELAAQQFEVSVIRKSLHKFGTVTVGEKIKRKLNKRKDTVSRRVQNRERYDREAAQAVTTLSALECEQLADAIQRAGLLCRGGDPVEFSRIYRSKDSLDRALLFVRNVHWGSCHERDALCRNPKLREAFGAWVDEANRVLRRPEITAFKKAAEKQALKKKLTAQRTVAITKLVEGTSAE